MEHVQVRQDVQKRVEAPQVGVVIQAAHEDQLASSLDSGDENVPGSSGALAVATRMGIPDPVVERARALLVIEIDVTGRS